MKDYLKTMRQQATQQQMQEVPASANPSKESDVQEQKTNDARRTSQTFEITVENEIVTKVENKFFINDKLSSNLLYKLDEATNTYPMSEERPNQETIIVEGSSFSASEVSNEVIKYIEGSQKIYPTQITINGEVVSLENLQEIFKKSEDRLLGNKQTLENENPTILGSTTIEEARQEQEGLIIIDDPLANTKPSITYNLDPSGKIYSVEASLPMEKISINTEYKENANGGYDQVNRTFENGEHNPKEDITGNIPTNYDLAKKLEVTNSKLKIESPDNTVETKYKLPNGEEIKISKDEGKALLENIYEHGFNVHTAHQLDPIESLQNEPKIPSVDSGVLKPIATEASLEPTAQKIEGGFVSPSMTADQKLAAALGNENPFSNIEIGKSEYNNAASFSSINNVTSQSR